MDIVDCVNKYLNDHPEDEMIFQEVSQRADLSTAEEKVLGNAIGRYCVAILDFYMKDFFDKLKDNKNDDNY